MRDATVPLISLEFAFRGGSAQDPADKAGLAEMAVGTLDEGAGELDSKLPRTAGKKAIELRPAASREHVRGTLRTLKVNHDEAFNLLRLALTSRGSMRRRGAHPRQIVSQLRAPEHQSQLHREPQMVGRRIPRPSLRTAVSGTLESVGAYRRRHARLCPPGVRARHAQDRVVGDVDADTAGRLVDRAFGALPAKAQLSRFRTPGCRDWAAGSCPL